MKVFILMLILLVPCISWGRTETRKVAKIRMILLDEAIEKYRRDVGFYPPVERGLEGLLDNPEGYVNWRGPYLKTQYFLIDPWSKPYIYIYPATLGGVGYDLYSAGRNGVDEHKSGDDIVHR